MRLAQVRLLCEGSVVTVAVGDGGVVEVVLDDIDLAARCAQALLRASSLVASGTYREATIRDEGGGQGAEASRLALTGPVFTR